MVRRPRAEQCQSDTDISYGVCAARVERPCLYVSQNTSARAVAQTVHIYFTFRELLEVWASGVWSWPCFRLLSILDQVNEPFSDVVSAFPALMPGD